MAVMLEVQHKGKCYYFHCRIQLEWGAHIVCHIPRDSLKTKNTVVSYIVVLHSTGTVRYGTVLYGIVWHTMVRYSLVYYGMVWCDIVRYGMVWQDIE